VPRCRSGRGDDELQRGARRRRRAAHSCPTTEGSSARPLSRQSYPCAPAALYRARTEVKTRHEIMHFFRGVGVRLTAAVRVAPNFVSSQPTETDRDTCRAEGTRPRALLYSRPVTRSPWKTLEGSKREAGRKNALVSLRGSRAAGAPLSPSTNRASGPRGPQISHSSLPNGRFGDP